MTVLQNLKQHFLSSAIPAAFNQSIFLLPQCQVCSIGYGNKSLCNCTAHDQPTFFSKCTHEGPLSSYFRFTVSSTLPCFPALLSRQLRCFHSFTPSFSTTSRQSSTSLDPIGHGKSTAAAKRNFVHVGDLRPHCVNPRRDGFGLVTRREAE